jgi:hypothetical protein
MQIGRPAVTRVRTSRRAVCRGDGRSAWCNGRGVRQCLGYDPCLEGDEMTIINGRSAVGRLSVREALHVGLKTGWSGLQAFFWEADRTRSTQNVRRPWTKRSSDSYDRMKIRCAQWNASRAAAWRRRRSPLRVPCESILHESPVFTSRFVKGS